MATTVTPTAAHLAKAGAAAMSARELVMTINHLIVQKAREPLLPTRQYILDVLE